MFLDYGTKKRDVKKNHRKVLAERKISSNFARDNKSQSAQAVRFYYSALIKQK